MVHLELLLAHLGRFGQYAVSRLCAKHVDRRGTDSGLTSERAELRLAVEERQCSWIPAYLEF